MDITLCTSEKCKTKLNCKRYYKNCNTINIYWQAYSDFGEIIEDDECIMFMEIFNEN